MQNGGKLTGFYICWAFPNSIPNRSDKYQLWSCLMPISYEDPRNRNRKNLKQGKYVFEQ